MASYNEKLRVLVATRILARMDTNIFSFRYLQRPLYRSKLAGRNTVKEDKASWYRKDGSTATFTVPTTPGSEVAKRIRKTLLQSPGPTGTRVKVLEKPGQPIMAGLGRNNPFPRKSCGRQGCPLVVSGQDCLETCCSDGILYTAQCIQE